MIILVGLQRSDKSRQGLTFTRFANEEEQENTFKEQYKNAVKLAIEDAKALKCPLFLQPLGIGVCTGWDPKLAVNCLH